MEITAPPGCPSGTKNVGCRPRLVFSSFLSIILQMCGVLIDHSFFADSPVRCRPETAQAFGGGDTCTQMGIQYAEKPIWEVVVEVGISFFLYLS